MRAAFWVLIVALAVPALQGPALPLPVQALHAPILIQGDAGFTAANGVVGGSGTAADPYVIAGWEILAVPGALDGIRIEGTRAHVVVRDVLAHEGDPGHPTSYCRYSLAITCSGLPLPAPRDGLVLVDAQNVAVEDSAFLRNGAGVRLERSAATLRGVEIAGKVSPLDPAGPCFDLTPVTVFPPPMPRYLTLHGAPAAGILTVDSTLAVEGGSVRCATVGIFGLRSASTVRGAALRDVGDGVSFWEGQLDVAGAEADAQGFAYTFAHTTGTLRDSAARGAQRGAWICGEGGSVLVQGNILEDGPGPDGESTAIDVGSTPGCPGAPYAELLDNAIGAGYAGIHWADSPGRIVGNTLTAGHWWGIYTQFASPEVRDNAVRGYDQGIIARCHQGMLAGNTLEGNARGLVVYHAGGLGCGPSVKPLAQGNAFLGNTVYDAVNTEDMLYTDEPTPGQVPLDVRGSWWGSASGPDMSQVRGALLAEPWRAAP